jgi:hypothetical protein
MEQCLAWRIYRDNKDSELHQLPFKNSKDRCFTPYRCQEVAGERDICKKCNEWRKKPLLLAAPGYGNYQVSYLGLVTEPIQAINLNRMAFSPWFMDMFKKHGMTPENLNKLRAAWAVAVAGLKDVPPLPDMGDGVVREVLDKSSWTPGGKEKKKAPAKKTSAEQKGVAPTEEDKSKKVAKVKTAPNIAESKVFKNLSQPSSDDAEPHIVVSASPQPEVKKRKYTKKKVDSSATSAPPPPPIAILSEEKPLDVDNVETIEVIARELNGTNYYLDTRKSKVYNPKNGLCVGLWDDKRNIIVPHDDSDVE